jgi:biofilm protein TabA
MIFDKIENIEKYNGISKWFNYVADFVKKTDLTSLPLGKTEIYENHVYVNVMEVETKKEEEVFFEFHKKYWDIHIDIVGVEKLQIGLERGSIVEEYCDAEDFGTFESEKYFECVLEQGYFMICMDGELHKPTLRCGECARIRKCVIKVEAENYE